MTKTTTTYSDLCASLWALSALRVAAESGLLAALDGGVRDVPSLARAASLDPEATSRILGILAAHHLVGRDETGHGLTEEGKQLAARDGGLLADLASTFGQTRSMVEEARRGTLAPGWRHLDAETIRAQGDLSAELSGRIIGPMTAAWPELGRLLAREGSRHLDVGVGAAGGAIALCRHYPHLRLVGIDGHRPAHLEARAAGARAAMQDRIELRLQRIEELPDEEAFETCFIASKFLPPDVLPVAFEKVHRALVPGGAVYLGGWRDPGDPRHAAASRLREHLWGGSALPAADVVRLLERAGFVNINEGPGRGDMAPLVAYRARA